MFSLTLTAGEKKGKGPVMMTADDLKWEQLKGAPDGVMAAMVKGDITKGAFDAFIKFPAGFKSPLHYHTHAMEAIVLKGAYVYNGKSYGPGSYVSIPAMDKHESGGAADSETIFFLEQPGKFDLVPVTETGEKK
jgi:quercetin dioxygenase-like cupin family protein